VSLINQMLKDLDQRRGMLSAEGALPPRQVRAVEAPRGGEWFWRVLAALVLIALGWVGWVAYQLQPRALATDLALQAAEQARRRAALPKPAPVPVAEASGTTAEAAKPAALSAPPAEFLRFAPAIESPITERAVKAVQAARAGPAPPPGGTPGGPGAEAKPGAARTLGLDLPAARVLPAPAGAAARLEKRERPRAPVERAEAEFRRAVALLNQGRGAEAEEGFAAALELDRSHHAARQALVALHLEQGHLDAARRLLQESLAADPAQPAFAAALARILVERKDFSAAHDVLQAAAGAAGHNAEFQTLRGTVLQRLGRHREAVEAYQSALRVQDANVQAWIGLGISLEALERRPAAADAFRRALAAGPANPELKTFAEQRVRALR